GPRRLRPGRRAQRARPESGLRCDRARAVTDSHTFSGGDPVNRRRPLLLVLAACALVAGCGPHKQLNLNLRAVGIPVPRLVTPAVALVPLAPPATASLPPLAPVDFSFSPPAVPSTVPTQPTRPAVACPKA